MWWTYLDFFIVTFLFALAWALAVAIGLGGLIIGVLIWVNAPGFRRGVRS